MTGIAVLGLGAMGSRMAANLLKAGFPVTVWNRTPAAAAALVSAGAQQAQTPRTAAAGADFVMAMVRDDDASRQVWLDPETGALAGMGPQAVAIESSTLTPAWIRELGAAAGGRGIALLEAPVSGSRPQAEAGTLVYFAGGDEATVQRSAPVLKAMGSAIHHVGSLGCGAVVKLCTNALLGIEVATLAELIGLMAKTGVDASRALAAIADTAVWSPAAKVQSASMLAGNFAPQFPVELIEKDFGYALQTADTADAAPMVAAARGVFQKAMAHGLGQSNMTSVIRLFTE